MKRWMVKHRMFLYGGPRQRNTHHKFFWTLAGALRYKATELDPYPNIYYNVALCTRQHGLWMEVLLCQNNHGQ